MATVRIEHFTDPGCPFAFSAEPRRLRLAWRYGDQLEWRDRMVVLSETTEQAMPPDRQAEGFHSLQQRHGMPIDWLERPRAAATLPACRAVVAAGLHAPERAPALLRRLRVLNFAAGGLLDDPALLAQAAREAGLDPAELERWGREPETEEVLRADMAAARDPSPAARAQDDKLGGPAEERRYTCPSYLLSANGTRQDLPGFRPLEVYVSALANLAPELDQRPDPESVEEVLAWARMPLATAEVAAVCDRDLDDVRPDLARVAAFEAVGGDGYWTLDGA